MKKYKIVLLIGATMLLLASCATSSENTSGYQSVQVIDVQTKANWTDPAYALPITAVIQPSDLMISPIIDIESLKTDVTVATSQTKSSTLEQEVRKVQIEQDIAANPTADTTLDDTVYGDKTSGQLALDAAAASFKYIKSPNAFTGAIATYDYIEGQIYEIITSPNAITDFRLKPGESIAGTPVVNNNGTSWQFSMGTSVENGMTVQHLFIKPSIVGLDTSMILLTNQRTYYFRVASFETSYMTALRFNYPIDSGEGFFVDEDFEKYIEESKEASDSVYKFDMTKANYSYDIKVAKGKPAWTPQNAFSDDLKTYIQFPVSILKTSDLPSVYVLRDKQETLVNYRIIGNLYQLDTIITDNESLLLKSGQSEQVKISRSK